VVDLTHVAEAQRVALSALAPALAADAQLVGGVAVTARVGHRPSLDLDIFTATTDPMRAVDAIAALPGVTIVSRGADTLHLEIVDVPVTLLRYPYPSIGVAERLPGFAVPVASMEDLTAMKLSAISGRGAAKDFWDLHELLSFRAQTLEGALVEFERKYFGHDRGAVVRSLAYFGDADAEPLPRGLTPPRWLLIKADLRQRIDAL
jgi:hypothetical protein